MAAFWEGMWGVVQATCSELDIDYLAYAEQHLAQGARAAGRPRRLAGGSPCRLTARRPTVPAA